MERKKKKKNRGERGKWEQARNGTGGTLHVRPYRHTNTRQPTHDVPVKTGLSSGLAAQQTEMISAMGAGTYSGIVGRMPSSTLIPMLIGFIPS